MAAVFYAIHLWDAENRQILCGNASARGEFTRRVADVTCGSCLRSIARITAR